MPKSFYFCVMSAGFYGVWTAPDTHQHPVQFLLAFLLMVIGAWPLAKIRNCPCDDCNQQKEA